MARTFDRSQFGWGGEERTGHHYRGDGDCGVEDGAFRGIVSLGVLMQW